MGKHERVEVEADADHRSTEFMSADGKSAEQVAPAAGDIQDSHWPVERSR
jgi:hypothetical protein